MSEPKYPDVTVELTGQDGNMFMIGGRVGAALRRSGVPREEITAFHEALYAQPSYDAALSFVMQTVQVE